MSHSGKNPIGDNSILGKMLQNAPDTGDLLKDMQRKLQGEFPDGRLNAHDEGALAVMVGHEKGRVMMKFPSPTAWIGFTPEQAMDIAQMLITHARQAGLVGAHSIVL